MWLKVLCTSGILTFFQCALRGSFSATWQSSSYRHDLLPSERRLVSNGDAIHATALKSDFGTATIQHETQLDSAISIEFTNDTLSRPALCPLVFVYMMQAPSVPKPEPIRQTDCRKIMWLTWANGIKPEHRGHIHQPGSSWTQGRNALLKRALHETPADYYIFLDDDVPSRLKVINGPNGDPWNIFEAFLIKWKPAVGYVAHYASQKSTPGLVTSGIGNVDANLNAFHSSTVGILLPYVESLDAMSWYFSQVIQSYIVAALYPSHRIGLNSLSIDNNSGNKHRYGATHRSHSWDVAKATVRDLFLPGTIPRMRIDKLFGGKHESILDWERCASPGLPSYRASCTSLRSVVNATHLIGRQLIQSCATSKENEPFVDISSAISCHSPPSNQQSMHLALSHSAPGFG